MLVIPAIDLIEGQCVRLSQGDYGKKTVYGVDPVEVARGFAREGATWIHVVDLDGAKEGMPMNLSVAEEIIRGCGLKVQYGGGLRSVDSVRRALDSGVERVVVGTRIAEDLREAEKWFKEFSHRLVASIDTKDGQVAVQGWTKTESIKGVDLARSLVERGCQRILNTDIATDGMLSGPNFNELEAFVHAVDVPIIASGGVANVEDLHLIRKVGCEGAIVGKALYEGRFELSESLADMARELS